MAQNILVPDAEGLHTESISAMFVPPPNIDLSSGRDAVLFGGRGYGKTMVLRALQYQEPSSKNTAIFAASCSLGRAPLEMDQSQVENRLERRGRTDEEEPIH